VLLYRRRLLRIGVIRLYATRRQHKRHRSSMAHTESSGGGAGGTMKLDFIPSFGASVRARREPGWKNLEDYDYD
jgi:hypothetical protein